MSNVYFGTKQVIATPMTRLAYDQYRGLASSDDEDGEDAGYLVEYIDGGGANHPDHEGYISWSPVDVFDRTYQSSNAMSFGHAIEAMKLGREVARTAWKGGDAWIRLCDQGESEAHRELGRIVMTIDLSAMGEPSAFGWFPKQADILADDWRIVER